MIWKGKVLVAGFSKRALLCTHENEDAWIPLSMIHNDSEIWSIDQLGETGVLAIPEWLAEKKGWL